MNNKFEKLQMELNYTFENIGLLKEAVTHSSYSNEFQDNVNCNERLEFLGDAVIELIISTYLFNKFKKYPEGKLTRLRSKIVCEEALYDIACKYNIGEYLKLGKGEESTGGRKRKSILADSVEAIIAAIYLDSDYINTEKLVLKLFDDYIKKAEEGKLNYDYKTKLQEVVQSINNTNKISYVVTKEDGPDHNKTFFVKVLISGKEAGRGKGKSKKNAEQKSASEALKKLNESLS
ncbi:MAG: ribonuclease III [Eubacteriales bacterium]